MESLDCELSEKIYLYVCQIFIIVYNEEHATLRALNWLHFAHRPWCTVTLNSNFCYLKKPENVFN